MKKTQDSPRKLPHHLRVRYKMYVHIIREKRNLNLKMRTTSGYCVTDWLRWNLLIDSRTLKPQTSLATMIITRIALPDAAASLVCTVSEMDWAKVGRSHPAYIKINKCWKNIISPLLDWRIRVYFTLPEIQSNMLSGSMYDAMILQ